MDGNLPDGPVVLYDDDHYYMGSVIAEKLQTEGLPVTLVTGADIVAEWSGNTGERRRVQKRLMELGVELLTAHDFEALDGNQAKFGCSYSGREIELEARAFVLVSCRRPHGALYRDLIAKQEDSELTCTIARIGDCDAPSNIAGAVYSGHKYAQELEAEPNAVSNVKFDRVFSA